MILLAVVDLLVGRWRWGARYCVHGVSWAIVHGFRSIHEPHHVRPSRVSMCWANSHRVT
jgi:hypothetical protein